MISISNEEVHNKAMEPESAKILLRLQKDPTMRRDPQKELRFKVWVTGWVDFTEDGEYIEGSDEARLQFLYETESTIFRDIIVIDAEVSIDKQIEQGMDRFFCMILSSLHDPKF